MGTVPAARKFAPSDNDSPRVMAVRASLELRLQNATDELVAFAGLADVLRLEAGGQPEEREERLGVEEERELDDPAL